MREDQALVPGEGAVRGLMAGRGRASRWASSCPRGQSTAPAPSLVPPHAAPNSCPKDRPDSFPSILWATLPAELCPDVLPESLVGGGQEAGPGWGGGAGFPGPRQLLLRVSLTEPEARSAWPWVRARPEGRPWRGRRLRPHLWARCPRSVTGAPDGFSARALLAKETRLEGREAGLVSGWIRMLFHF